MKRTAVAEQASETAARRAVVAPDLLRVARGEERVLVTENVRDFVIIHREFLAAGEVHSGLILVPPGRSLSEGGIARMIADLDSLVRGRAEVGMSANEALWL